MATILIVDDRPVNRDVLFTLLGYWGHRILEASNGAEALALVQAEHPDLVIADILMPTMDGYELVRQLRADPAIAHTPVILCTAHYHEREVRALAEACGVAHVLFKPYEPEAVLGAVEKVLGLAGGKDRPRRDAPSDPSPSPISLETFDREHLRLLTDKLSEKVEELQTANERLSTLIELGQQLASERDPLRLLENYCRAARDLLGARHAALAVFQEDAQTVRHFCLSGMESPAIPAFDVCLRDPGLLGEIMASRRPLRWHDLEGDPRRVGLPPYYPPFRSFLGVPLTSPSHTYGWLCLTDKLGAEAFSEQDEHLVLTLAVQVAIAYENVRLYREVHEHVTRLEQEVEERRQAEEALQEAVHRRDEFLAMLAHELRNPVAPILSAVQFMGLRGLADPPMENAKAIIERQVRHLARLLDDLLDVSRITRDKIELRPDRLDLSHILSDAVEASHPEMEGRGHRLLVSLPPETLWVQADRTRMVQVLTNLLKNAAKYTEPGGTIWLTLTREGSQAPGSGPGQAVIAVRDTGFGIAPDLLPRIFDLFFQVDRSLAHSQGGLGLGLTVVRKLVEMHGGSVTAASAGPGQGSEFVVRLPLAQPEKATDRPGAALPDSRSRRIVLVEDNPDSREMLKQLLQLLGHQVEVAADGPSGIETIRRFRPEVALIDIGLPGQDGYQVAQAVRAEPFSRDIFLVALTGYSQPEDRQRTQDAGFDAHLVKPVGLEELGCVLAGGRINGERARPPQP